MKWMRRTVVGLLAVACALTAMVFSISLGSERPVGFALAQTKGQDGKPIAIGVWYPTDTRAWPTRAGFMLLTLAKDAPVAGHTLPLVVISHGNGGGMLGHADLALALASAGYVVATPMHNGDNSADQSGVGSVDFLSGRSRDLHATLDYMLTAWPERARIDPHRIGAFGMSMGGFGVLTAAGARPDLRLLATHCATTKEFACDVLRHFKSPLLDLAAPSLGLPFVSDPRIRAAVLAAPGLGFTMPHGLDGVQVPVQLWSGGQDGTVGDAPLLRAALGARVEFHAVPGAGHLSFLAPCPAIAPPLALCKDPGNFDRAAMHAAMNASVTAFFNRQLR